MHKEIDNLETKHNKLVKEVNLINIKYGDLLIKYENLKEEKGNLNRY